MKVSVAVPTYNGEAYVAEAIRSILAQTFTDFELVIVDDRSTDKTLDILRSFSDPRIRITRNEERLGLVGNWNRCLQETKGDAICIFHQDDVMLLGNLEEKLRILDSNASVGLVHSAAELLVETGAPSPPVDWIEKSAEDFIVDGREYFRKLLFQGNLLCAPTVLASRRQLLELGGFDEELTFTSDYEMWLKMCAVSRIAFLSRPLIRYRWHEANASHAYRFERGIDESLVAAKRALGFFLEKTGRKNEEAIFREALAAVTRLKRWASGLEKQWLNSEEAILRKHIEKQKTWIIELEKGKAWLDEDRTTLQKTVVGLEKMLQEQKAWIGELERGKTWLDEQRLNWQRLAEASQTQIEVKLSKLDRKFSVLLAVLTGAVILLSVPVFYLLGRLLGIFK